MKRLQTIIRSLLLLSIIYLPIAGQAAPECDAPRFTHQQPAAGAVVKELSSVYFESSQEIRASSIAVKIKGEPLKTEIAFDGKTKRHKVQAQLPTIMRLGEIRVNVYAKTTDGCAVYDYWLITVEGEIDDVEE
ncbi:MAG: hypothetical protein P1U80_05160 [Pseudomonadales bacterium]|nr:hypothetical protein [Pseudomonadales bacterium]